MAPKIGSALQLGSRLSRNQVKPAATLKTSESWVRDQLVTMTATSNDGVIDEDRFCTHIRSKRSVALDRDTFVFWSSAPSNLLVGLNQRLTHATIAGLHRWMRTVLPYMPDAELRPAAVRKFDVLRYTVVPRADALTALDTSPLPSGDYGLFRVGDYERDLFGYAEPVARAHEASFERYLQLSEKHPDTITRLDLVCAHC
ncbi:hypothetical protein JB92DRAFT_1894083 [Gautieria morchelliformis]|nr:hypothetical protein JB92DRAFT_1894083 [Gautieria morchelliformis]